MTYNSDAVAEEELEKVAGTRILVAEDNATNQLVVSRFLNQLGCKFDIAGNGQEALDALPNREYDLVLMDVSMPGMDGYEATRQIRMMEGELSKIPIVALTAYASVEDRKSFFPAAWTTSCQNRSSRMNLQRQLQRTGRTAMQLSKLRSQGHRRKQTMNHISTWIS